MVRHPALVGGTFDWSTIRISTTVPLLPARHPLIFSIDVELSSLSHPATVGAEKTGSLSRVFHRCYSASA
jgi:hypothetical protein